jgi:hypothetical protein
LGNVTSEKLHSATFTKRYEVCGFQISEDEMGGLCNTHWDIAIFRTLECPQGGDIIRHRSRHLVCMREERITHKKFSQKTSQAQMAV